MATVGISPIKEHAPLPGTLPASERELRKTFLEETKVVPGAGRISQCLQCGTCTGSCPVSYAMDLSPRMLIALFRAGQIEEILRSRTIWICASCYMCTTRCPQNIKITDLLYALKRTAIDAGLYPEKFPVYLLSKNFARLVNRYGRNQEMLLLLLYYLRRNPFGGSTSPGAGAHRAPGPSAWRPPNGRCRAASTSRRGPTSRSSSTAARASAAPVATRRNGPSCGTAPGIARWIAEREPTVPASASAPGTRLDPTDGVLALQPFVDERWLSHELLRFGGEALPLSPPRAVAALGKLVARLAALYA